MDKSGYFSYSNVLKINTEIIGSSISVNPNPITENKINLNLQNLVKGDYILSITNNLGQTVYRSVIRHSGGSLTKSIVLPVKMPKGNYLLNLSSYKVQIILQ